MDNSVIGYTHKISYKVYREMTGMWCDESFKTVEDLVDDYVVRLRSNGCKNIVVEELIHD